MDNQLLSAVLIADHFQFKLEFERVLNGTSELVGSDVVASLILSPPRSIAITTETFLRGDELHALRSIVRDIIKMNGSLIPVAHSYGNDGRGFDINLTSVLQYHGSPSRLPEPPDEMPCTCGVSFASRPDAPELGAFISVTSTATSSSVREFLSSLDRIAGVR